MSLDGETINEADCPESVPASLCAIPPPSINKCGCDTRIEQFLRLQSERDERIERMVTQMFETRMGENVRLGQALERIDKLERKLKRFENENQQKFTF